MAAADTAVLETAAHARLLALGFAPPTADGLERLHDLANRLGEHALAAALVGVDPLHVASEHLRLFGPNGTCPPYQGLYEGDPFQETRQMSDLAGFYGAFGAEPEGPVHERPDHVGCELEFVAFLCLARDAAREDGNPELELTCREAEDAFLRDHLARWLGRFCLDVTEATSDAVYTALAAVGARFAEGEIARRGLDVRLVGPRRSQRSQVEEDNVTCGAASAAASPLVQIHGKEL
jgi:TorA maturation chaperone TorD